MSIRLALTLVIASLATACGLGDLLGEQAPVHCDFRKGSSNGPEDRCQELVPGAPQAGEMHKAACLTAQATPGDGLCPREGVVGGCDLGKQLDGTETRDWYYAPMTREEARSSCGDDTPLDP